MDSPSPVITKISTPSFKKVVIEASDGNRYYSDLTSFSKVYCFPKTESDWKQVSVDSYGLGLVWTSRFEVHVDQVIGLAAKVESIQQAG